MNGSNWHGPAICGACRKVFNKDPDLLFKLPERDHANLECPICGEPLRLELDRSPISVRILEARGRRFIQRKASEIMARQRSYYVYSSVLAY